MFRVPSTGTHNFAWTLGPVCSAIHQVMTRIHVGEKNQNSPLVAHAPLPFAQAGEELADS